MLNYSHILSHKKTILFIMKLIIFEISWLSGILAQCHDFFRKTKLKCTAMKMKATLRIS